MIEKNEGRFVKILIDIDREDGVHEVESVWAIAVDNGYQLDSIPFYARGFAWGDLVSAIPDPDGILRCTGLVVPSGHSTIRLWFADEREVQSVRTELGAMHCDSELDLNRLVAVDIPDSVPYAPVRDYLNEKERAGILEYEEACLGQS